MCGETLLNPIVFDALFVYIGGLLVTLTHFAIFRGRMRRKVKQVSAMLLNMSQLDPSWRQALLEFGIRDAALHLLRGFYSGELAQIRHFLHPELATQWQTDVKEMAAGKALMRSVEIKVNGLQIVDVQKSAAPDGDLLTVCIDVYWRGINSSGQSVGAFTERFWTFRKIQGRWLLWRESEYSAWQRFINAPVVDGVVPHAVGNLQPALLYEASSLKRRTKFFPFLFALMLASSFLSWVSVFMSRYWRPEQGLDTQLRLIELVVPLGFFLYLLVRRSALRILERNYAEKSAYVVSLFFVGCICFQAAISSVTYLSLPDEPLAKVAMRARGVDKDTQGVAVKWNPPLPQQIGNEQKITKWPDGSVRSVEPVHNGNIHGIAVLTFPSGQLYGKIPYVKGKKHGRFELYREDGSLDQILSYKDGRLHGMCEWFNADGSLMTKGLYIEGELVESN